MISPLCFGAACTAPAHRRCPSLGANSRHGGCVQPRTMRSRQSTNMVRCGAWRPDDLRWRGPHCSRVAVQARRRSDQVDSAMSAIRPTLAFRV